jgi:hypothetical protein
MAETALRQLQSSFETQVELASTDYAGHAREIAETWACEHIDGTIIGIGGDGTLNEIGNGILSATAACGSRVVLVVCGGGNANDQYRSWPPSQRIQLEDVLSADPIAVRWPPARLWSTAAGAGCSPILPSSPRRCCERGRCPW